MENAAVPAAPAAVLLALFVVFVAALLGGEAAQRLRLPAVVGQIAAGCAVGPSGLGWVRPDESLEVLSEVGAVLLLFSVGLETRVGDLRAVGKAAGLVGVLGVALPFALGTGWALWSGQTAPKALFFAAAFVATSAGITARVLQELGALGRREGRVILGAAVIDDVLAMLLLGVVTSLQGGGGSDWGRLGVVLAEAVAFVVAVAWLGTALMRRRSELLDAPADPLSPLTLSLALCLGLAAAAASLGLAAIIGAFLAGTVLAESRQRAALVRHLAPLQAFLVPFFFAVTGAKVDLGQFGSAAALGALGAVTLLAVAGKLVGGALGALPLGLRPALVVGVGMVPRGEVGIIVASLGLRSGAFTEFTYSLIVAMSLLTSVAAPPVLRALLERGKEQAAAGGRPDTGSARHA